MALQMHALALGNLQDDGNGNNYAVGVAVYILKYNGTLADIYRDGAGQIAMPQDGINNVSSGSGEFVFYIEAGQYIVRVNGKDAVINVVGSTYFDSRIDDAVQSITDATSQSRGFRFVGAFADGFTYELFNDVGIDANGNSWIYVGAGAPNKVVTAGTVPSAGAGYEQVTFNALQQLAGLELPSGLDRVYSRVFKSASDMINSDYLQVGDRVRTISYYDGWAAQSTIPIGGCEYVVLSPLQYTTTPDEEGVFTLQNGNIAFPVIGVEGIDPTTFGCKGDGITDDTGRMLSASVFAVSLGYKLIVPPLEFVINDLTLPENINIEALGSQNASSSTMKTPIFKCTNGEFCIETTFPNIVSRGYRISGLTIIGHETAHYGLKAIGTSGFLGNITVRGFPNGVGVRYSRGWRGAVDTLSITNCSVGLLVGFTDEAVNGTQFENLTIELCRVGMYTFDIPGVPQIGNVFNSCIIEACGSKYYTATWPSFLTLSSDFKADTGMTESTVEGSLIIERNFYSTWVGFYLEVNSGVYFWQGSTGYTSIDGGVIEMTEPSNDYAGSPLILKRSPCDILGVRLTWDDSRTSPIFTVSSLVRGRIENLIFNTSGADRPLYYDGGLSSAAIRPGKYTLTLRDGSVLRESSIVTQSKVMEIPLLTANLRIPANEASTFVFNGISQDTSIDIDRPVNGQEITIIVKQDVVGGHSVTLSSSFLTHWDNNGNIADSVSSITFVRVESIGKFIKKSDQTKYTV